MPVMPVSTYTSLCKHKQPIIFSTFTIEMSTLETQLLTYQDKALSFSPAIQRNYSVQRDGTAARSLYNLLVCSGPA